MRQIKRACALAVVAGALTLSTASPAMKQNGPEACEIDLRVDKTVQWRGPFGRGYEVLSDAPALETVMVRVVHRGPPCRFYLTASPARGGDPLLIGPQGKLTYDLLADPNGPSVLTPEYLGTSTSQVSGEFASPGERSIPLYVAVPSGQFVSGGRYLGQAALRAFRSDADGPVLVAEAPISIQVPVAPVLEVRSGKFGPGRRSLGLNLGMLSQERRELVDFQVLTNAAVTMRLESANSGVLKHQAGAPPIAYEVQINGHRLQLSKPVLERLQTGSSEHHSVPVEIIVAGPDGVRAAGTYQDLLTITFKAD